MYKLKELRKSLALSQQEFGKKINKAPARISEYESGKHKMGLDVACKIMDTFGVTASVDSDTQDWVFVPKNVFPV